MKITKLFLVLGVAFALSMMVSPALADVTITTEADVDTEEITYLVGDTETLIATITYDAEFEYLDDANALDPDETIILIIDYSVAVESGYSVDVSWSGDGGVRGNEFTPKNKVDGDFEAIAEITDVSGATDAAIANGQVELTFDFDELHYKAGRGSGKGNAHFHVNMDVAWSQVGDSLSGTESIKFGVNCHVEDLDYTPPV